MSRRPGEILVRLTQEDSAAMAEWIFRYAIPMYEARADTVLTPGYNSECAESLRKLATQLHKVASRARNKQSSRMVTINIDRHYAKALVAVIDRHRHPESAWFAPTMPRPLPIGLRRVLICMRAAMVRPGRKRLSADQQSARIERRFSVCERQRQKVDLQKRRAEVQAVWLTELRKRNETILTTSLAASGKLP